MLETLGPVLNILKKKKKQKVVLHRGEAIPGTSNLVRRIPGHPQV